MSKSGRDAAPHNQRARDRRAFLAAVGRAASCALVVPVVQACEVSRVRGDTSIAAEIDLDLSTAEYAPLADVGGMVGVDSGAAKLLLIRDAADSLVCFDRFCPHSSLDMTGHPAVDAAWDPSARQLTCPWHFSKFDAVGERVAGPTPTGINRYRIDFDATANTATIFPAELITEDA